MFKFIVVSCTLKGPFTHGDFETSRISNLENTDLLSYV